MNHRTVGNSEAPLDSPALLLRPSKGEDESFPAYLTRLSTVNRLTGTRALAKRLKLSEGELLTLEPLALQRLLHGDRSLANEHRELYRNRPDLLPLRPDSFQITRICPMCFKAGCLHPKLWDRPLTIICEIHQVCLLDRCPACRRLISHRRAHVNFCSCGTDFRKCVQLPKPPWLDLLYEIFAPWRVKEPFDPMEHIDRERRSLVVLLNFLLSPSSEKVAVRRKGRIESIRTLDLSLIGDIGNLLGEWPVNFERRVLEMHEISRRFIWKLVLRMSKLQLAELRNAVKATLRQKRRNNLLLEVAQRQFQQPGPISTIGELMQLTGLAQVTIWKAIGAGTIKCTISGRGKSRTYKRITVPMADSKRLRALSRCSVGYAAAARYLNCPMAYVRFLVLWGELPSIQYTKCLSTWRFRVKHLKQLMSRLNALAGPERVATGPLCTLADATPRTVCGSPTQAWKTFTRDILEGKVRLYRVGGEATDFASLAVQISNLPIRPRRKRQLSSGKCTG